MGSIHRDRVRKRKRKFHSQKMVLVYEDQKQSYFPVCYRDWLDRRKGTHWHQRVMGRARLYQWEYIEKANGERYLKRVPYHLAICIPRK
jgi:hypothetical protein